MSIGQIIILSLLGLFSVVCVVKTNLAENDESKVLASMGQYIISLITLSLLTVMVLSYNRVKDKCPEYEKLENVYKLKEK